MNAELNKIGFSGYKNIYKDKQGILIQNIIKQHDPCVKNMAQYSTDNIRANYMVNFKGNLSGDSLIFGDNICSVNHETRFFREPKTDETVQNYVLNNFSNEPEINIVSGACSTGEEAKSYAMMLDSLGDKLHVFGFDILDNVVNQAASNKTRLILNANVDATYSFNIHSSNAEKFLFYEDQEDVTPYQKRCQEKFKKNYYKIGDSYKGNMYPNASNEYSKLEKKLNEILQKTEGLNEDELEKKYGDMLNQIYSRMVKLSKTRGTYCIYQDYEAKEESFKNCSFKQGNVLELEQLYKPNSVNVLLYRNALYHTLCTNTVKIRIACDNAQETMDSIAKQMNKVVKKDGLVVFGEDEESQGIDNDVIKKSMENNGFKKLVQNGELLDNIWVKVEDLNENE